MGEDNTSAAQTQAELGALRERVAELELADARLRLLSSVVEQSAEGVAVVDSAGVVQSINSAFARMHGYAPHELLGKHLSIFHTPEQMPQVDEANRRLRESGHFRGEVWHARRDGTAFPAMMHNALLRDAGGQPAGMIGMMTDIGEQKAAQEALRHAYQFSRAIEDTIDGLIVVLDRQGRIVRFNAACERLSGWRADEAIGRCLWDFLIPEEQRAGVRATFDRLSAGEFPTRHENDWVARDGTRRWIAWANSILRDAEGGVEYIMGTGIDFTQRKRADEELRRYREQLEERVAEQTQSLARANERLQAELAERRRTEAELRRSQQRLELALWATDLGTWDYNLQTGHVVYDERWAGMLGYTLDELEPHVRTWERLVHPEDTLDVQQALRAHREGRTPFYEAEHRLRSKSGEWKWVLTRGKVVERDARGQPVRMTGTHRDITEHKRADELLRESEQKFRTLAETVAAGILIYQSQVLRYANPAVERITGFARGELYGMTPWDLAHPEFQTLVRERSLARQRGEPAPPRYEIKLLTKQGTERWVDVSAAPLEYEGQPAVLVAAFDITERKQAEESLRESEERYRTLVENIADGVALVVDGRTEYVSPATCRIGGWTVAQMLERSFADFATPEYRAVVEDWTARAAAGEAPPPTNAEVWRADGGRAHVELLATAIRRGGRSVLLCVIRDVTERKRIEREREFLAKQLHEAQKMEAVGQVAAGIAHDFGNLLAVARTAVKQLGERLAEDAVASETLDTIAQAVEEATTSTQSLLLFSRRVPAERVPLKLCDLVRESAQVLRHLLSRAVTLHVETRSPCECWVSADASQLQQVLLNLTLNARDAMPSGGTLDIRVTPLAADGSPQRPRKTGRQPAAVQLVVCDTGTGIPADVLPHVFEPFFTTKPAGKGTGLGLATVHSIIRDHGGRIEASSEPGGGSRFTLTLPTLSADVVGAGRLTAVAAPAGRGRVALLAEPGQHIRRLMVTTLRSWNFEVQARDTAAEVCAAYFSSPERIAVLILNDDPPECTGQRCLKEIRQLGHQAPVILTVRATDPSAAHRLDEHTVRLHRPFTMAALGAALSALSPSQPAEGGDR